MRKVESVFLATLDISINYLIKKKKSFSCKLVKNSEEQKILIATLRRFFIALFLVTQGRFGMLTAIGCCYTGTTAVKNKNVCVCEQSSMNTL